MRRHYCGTSLELARENEGSRFGCDDAQRSWDFVARLVVIAPKQRPVLKKCSVWRRKGLSLLAAKTHKNLAETALAAGDMPRVLRETELTVAGARASPDTHEKAFLLIGAGRLYQQVFVGAPNTTTSCACAHSKWTGKRSSGARDADIPGFVQRNRASGQIVRI